ncbi:hypothetical protein Fmac_030085 [Flemingia macrophylla]|uniref:FHA domain-containing protein n=1 Tax=Flemingia macrophylla TaxID=520843 RepID=A0ABD1LC62_9FABA
MEAEEEEAPILRLEILQGPREGESLEFKPGSAIRIGRVLRGNTLPIKDPGISSKHLSILTESNKWILQDLHSSNGTVFNASAIPPHTPVTLHHHSTIKIGELTSIRVIFLPQSAPFAKTQPLPPPLPRARGRGRGRGRVQIQSVDATVVDAEPERVAPPARATRKSNRERGAVRVSDDSPEEKAGKRHKNARNVSFAEVSDSSVGSLGVPVEAPKNARVTRNSRTARAVVGSVECGVENVEKKKSKGATAKRELLQEEVEDGSENRNCVVRVCDDAPGEKVEEQRKSTRKRCLVEVSDSSVGNLDVPAEVPKNNRVTRNSKKARAVTGNVDKKKSNDATERRELQKEAEDSVVKVCDDALAEKVEEQRKSTRNPSLVEVSDSSVGDLDVPVEEPKNKRVARNSKKARAGIGNVDKKSKDANERRELQKKVEDGREEENVNSAVRICDDALGEKVEEKHKSTRNLTLVEVSESSVADLDVPVEEPKNTHAVSGSVQCGVENVEKKKNEGANGKRELLQKAGEDGRENENVISDAGDWPDLKSMTLGQWFDFLELHLPKQIIDESEEMIDSMTRKSERLREYIAEMQQQNDKGTMPTEE